MIGFGPSATDTAPASRSNGRAGRCCSVTLAIIWTVVFWFPNRPLVIVAVAIPVAIVCSLIAAKTTRGGWHWRWGDKD